MKPAPPAVLLSPAFHLGLILTGIVAGASVQVSHAAGPLALLGLTLLAAVALRTPAMLFLRHLLPLLSFGLLALLLLVAAPVPPGTPVVALPLWGRPVSAHAAGFLLALWVKSGLIVLWLTALGHALTERDVLEGLMALRLPPRVTALTYLMLRGLHLVREDVQRLVRAREARGRPRGLYALRVAAALSQALLVRLGRRAETQGLALAARGFAGRLPLVDVRPLGLAPALSLILLTGALVWLTRL